MKIDCSKIVLLCSTEKKIKNYTGFGKTWCYENYDRIFSFGWTVPTCILYTGYMGYVSPETVKNTKHDLNSSHISTPGENCSLLSGEVLHELWYSMLVWNQIRGRKISASADDCV